MKSNRSLLGSLVLFIAAFLWGTSFVAQRIASNYLTSVAYNAIRISIGTCVIFIVIVISDLVKHKLNKPIKKFNIATILGGIICGFCVFFATTTQQIGLETTTAGKSGFITALYVAFVPVIGLLIGRRTPALGWIAIPVAILGFALMSISNDMTVTMGDAITLMCALLFSCHILLLDMFDNVDPLKITFVQFFTASVIGIIWMCASNQIPEPSQVADCIGPILYVGILSTCFAYSCQTIGQRMVAPALATLIMSLESVVALVAGAVILHESASVKEAVGVILVFIAVMIAQQAPYKVFLDNDFALNKKGEVIKKRSAIQY